MKLHSARMMMFVLIGILLSAVGFVYAETAEEYTQLGTAYAEKGHNEEAEANYDKAIEIDPNCAKAYYFRAKLRLDFNYGLGDSIESGTLHPYIRQSISDLIKAIEINPNYVEAYQGLGRIYNKKILDEDKPLAASYFSKAIELNPAYAETYIFNQAAGKANKN